MMSEKPHPKSMAAHFADDSKTLVPVRSENINVFSWCPTPDGTGPATQVHMVLAVPGVNANFVMRFHSPHTLTKLIDALVFHRDDVWPKEKAS